MKLIIFIIFNKQFFVLCADEKKFTRLRSLMKYLSLENRFIESIEDFRRREIELLTPIDYKNVNCILASVRERYKAFIFDNI